MPQSFREHIVSVVKADTTTKLKGINEGLDGRKTDLTEIGSKYSNWFQMAHRDTITLDHRSQCVLEKALMTLWVLKRPSWTLGTIRRALLYGVVSNLVLK